MRARAAIGLLAAMAAASFVSSHAQADEAVERLLYGGPIVERALGYACFERVYDSVHLKSHPQQNVTRMTTVAYLAERPGGEEHVVNFVVAFRKGGVPGEYSGSCKGGGKGGALDCALECDGGSFAIAARGASSVLVTVTRQFETCDGGEGFGADDTSFRLDRSDMRACADMIWEDEMRGRILKDAGIAP